MSNVTRRGYEGILYYGTAGSTAATQVTNCEDLDYDTQAQKSPTTIRGDGSAVPITTERVTGYGVTLTWKMQNRPSDTTLAALLAAARSTTGSAVALKTKSWSSGKGYDGDCTLSVKETMPLAGMTVYEFSATPTDDEGRTPQLNAS